MSRRGDVLDRDFGRDRLGDERRGEGNRGPGDVGIGDELRVALLPLVAPDEGFLA
jgi:hypothetical protein